MEFCHETCSKHNIVICVEKQRRAELNASKRFEPPALHYEVMFQNKETGLPAAFDAGLLKNQIFIMEEAIATTDTQMYLEHHEPMKVDHAIQSEYDKSRALLSLVYLATDEYKQIKTELKKTEVEQKEDETIDLEQQRDEVIKELKYITNLLMMALDLLQKDKKS